MKKFFTLFASICLIATSATAQTATVSTTDPNPTPGFSTALNVTALNTFESNSTTNFNEFPKNKTTTIISPEYYYSTPQSSIFFLYNFTTAPGGNGGTAITNPTISISYGTTVTAIANAFTIANGTGNYYFTINLLEQIPANTTFRISLTMTLGNDKLVTANTLTTNAIRGTPSQTPLPIKLTGFAGSIINNKAQLKWSVDDNETGDYFEIQKSNDGRSFTNAAKVEITSKVGTENYTFNEVSELTSGSYYRLKIVNKDNSISYSRIINLKSAKGVTGNNISMLQNPVRSSISFNYMSSTGDAATITVYNTAGVRVYSSKMNMHPGQNAVAFNLDNALAPGQYILEVANATERTVTKLVKL